MADETTQPSGQPAAEGGTPPPAAAGEGNDPQVVAGLTTEELDAQWRNRMSGKDKAHAVEAKTLRDQIAAQQAQIDKDRSEREQARLAGMSEAERVVAERDALKAQLDAEKVARKVDLLRVKYPNIAADLGDEVIAAMDEAKLSALNERLSAGPQQTGSPPSLIDPTSAARTLPAGQKPVSAKTREELLADLKAESPAFVASLGTGRINDQ